MDEKASFMCDLVSGDECIVGMHWEMDWSPTSSFKDVFLSTAPYNVKDCPVEIKVCSKLPNNAPGQWVSVRLDKKVKLL